MLKKYVLPAFVVLVFLSTSPAKTTAVERAFRFHKRQELNTQTQTKNVLRTAAPKHQRKLLVKNDLGEDPTDDVPGPDELDLQVAYKRPRIHDQPKPNLDHDPELSPYVQVRLAVARARAMSAYKQKYTSA